MDVAGSLPSYGGTLPVTQSASSFHGYIRASPNASQLERACSITYAALVPVRVLLIAAWPDRT